MDKILDKIRSGEIKMTPKWHFALRVFLLVTLTVITLMTSAFLLSFLFWSLGVSGHLFLLGFGLRGLAAFILLFPWVTLVFEIVLLFALQKLLKNFPLGYKNPFVYIGTFILLIVVGSALFIDESPVHERLLERSDRNELPIIGEIYERLNVSHEERGVLKGTILSVANDSCMLEIVNKDYSTSTRKIIFPPEFYLKNSLAPGDTILVAGDADDMAFRAYGVKKISR